MKRIFVLILVGLSLASFSVRVQGAPPSEGRYVPNQVLVQFREDATLEEEVDALARISPAAREHVAEKAAGRAALVLASLAGGTVDDAVARLADHPAVEFAEPNWIYTHGATSNDTLYTNGSLWGMYGDGTSPANPYGSQAAEAWAAGHTGAKGVYIGVIDEGINFSHEDLAANVWTNPFDPVDGRDNDGNGYVDDLHGWDFHNNDNSIYDGRTKSGSVDEHGTHVSGTIGAVGGNGKGVAGVNWNVTLISGKFLGSRGGTASNAIRAINYFTDLKIRHGLNIVATSNSWGGASYSQAMLDAITRAAKQNILFVAAAMNDGTNNDTTARYPSNYNTTAGAGYDAVISVAALASDGTLASWSNFGRATVDLGAPGVNIRSTTPGNGYLVKSGTSMAAPHVSGGVALYASTHPGATAKEIRDAILNSTVPTPSLSGKTVTGGRLNVSGY